MSRKHDSSASAPTELDATGLDEAKKLVAQLVALVGTMPALSAKDRARSSKLRKGGETVIPTVAALSDQYGLSIASHSTTTMVSGAKKAQSLLPLYNQLIQATKQVSDQMFSANAQSWGAATVHYTMLKRLAKTNGDLAEALVPVQQFFAQRSAAVIAAEKAKKDARKAAKAAAAASATPAAATTASAPAPAAAVVTVTPAAAPASAPTATPTSSAPISTAAHV